MKTPALILLAWLPATVASSTDAAASLIRLHRQDSGVVWDMPSGTAHNGLPHHLRSGRSELQFWKVEQDSPASHLLDQRLIGGALPEVEIRIKTLDPDCIAPRTRVDQPFSVDIQVSGLLTDQGFPRSVSSVLLERHVHPGEASVQAPAKPHRSAYLSENGRTVLRFPASAIQAKDPTQAHGHEEFVIHTLAEGQPGHTQLATAKVRVLPVASGEIRGIIQGGVIDKRAPKVELVLKDLYPKSDTRLMLYEGTEIHGNPGTVVRSLVIDRKDPLSTTIRLQDFTALMPKNGNYTLALVSDTVYGRELLCTPVTFRIQRPPRMNQADLPKQAAR